MALIVRRKECGCSQSLYSLHSGSALGTGMALWYGNNATNKYLVGTN